MSLTSKTVILKVLLVLSNISSCSKIEEHVEEKCYEGLGCVRLTPEWFHPRYRPENVLPAERHAVNTIFVIWTLNNQNLTHEILGTDLERTHIKCCLKILVHDFTSSGYTGWIHHLARAYLLNPNTSGSNIVSVDWAAGAEPPYLLAVANARLVALEIVHFIHKLKKLYKLDPGKVHIIGHGLGGHIAGYVGKLTRMRKITALDPSGPYFTRMPPQVRLHKEDANFVEVIHTDASPHGQGISDLLGHVDFYPNGGRYQPGCRDVKQKLTFVKRSDLQLGQTLSACSHKRSLKYYIEAFINKSCKFMAVACSSFKDLVKGHCLSCGAKSEYCVLLHPTSMFRTLNNTYGFYFVTSDSSPFCGEMIKVFLELKSESSRHGFVKGHFNVTIPQSIGDVNFLLNENQAVSALRTNEQHVFLVFRSTPPPLVLPAQGVQIQWVHGCMPCSWCVTPQITGLTIQKISDQPDKDVQHFCTVSSASSIDETAQKIVGFEPCSNSSAHKHLSETLTTHHHRSATTTEQVYADYY